MLNAINAVKMSTDAQYTKKKEDIEWELLLHLLRVLANVLEINEGQICEIVDLTLFT